MPTEVIQNDKHLRQLPISIRDENPEKKTREILDKIDKVNENLQLQSNLRNEKLYKTTVENIQSNNIDDNNEPTNDGHKFNQKITHEISYTVPTSGIQNSPFPGQLLNGIPQHLQAFNSIDRNSIYSNPAYSAINNRFASLPSVYLQPPQLPLQYYQTLNPPLNRDVQYPWPFAQFFPILIKDPFITALGGFTEPIIQNGPQADLCSKENDKSKPKITGRSKSDKRRGKNLKVDSLNNKTVIVEMVPKNSTKNENYDDDDIEDEEGESKVLFFPLKYNKKGDKNKDDEQGKIRLPFRTKMSPDVVENPGFYINRLRVRKGGVAIAGPYGIATAGSGGTAIVGPDGVAYTKPDGLAIAGPGAKVVSLPENLNLGKLVEKLSKQKIVDSNFDDEGSGTSIEGEYVQKEEGNRTKRIFIPKGGKIVATGPTIYKNPSA